MDVDQDLESTSCPSADDLQKCGGYVFTEYRPAMERKKPEEPGVVGV